MTESSIAVKLQGKFTCHQVNPDGSVTDVTGGIKPNKLFPEAYNTMMNYPHDTSRQIALRDGNSSRMFVRRQDYELHQFEVDEGYEPEDMSRIQPIGLSDSHILRYNGNNGWNGYQVRFANFVMFTNVDVIGEYDDTTSTSKMVPVEDIIAVEYITDNIFRSVSKNFSVTCRYIVVIDRFTERPVYQLDLGTEVTLNHIGNSSVILNYNCTLNIDNQTPEIQFNTTYTDKGVRVPSNGIIQISVPDNKSIIPGQRSILSNDTNSTKGAYSYETQKVDNKLIANFTHTRKFSLDKNDLSKLDYFQYINWTSTFQYHYKLHDCTVCSVTLKEIPLFNIDDTLVFPGITIEMIIE